MSIFKQKYEVVMRYLLALFMVMPIYSWSSVFICDDGDCDVFSGIGLRINPTYDLNFEVRKFHYPGSGRETNVIKVSDSNGKLGSMRIWKYEYTSIQEEKTGCSLKLTKSKKFVENISTDDCMGFMKIIEIIHSQQADDKANTK